MKDTDHGLNMCFIFSEMYLLFSEMQAYFYDNSLRRNSISLIKEVLPVKEEFNFPDYKEKSLQ